MQLGQNKHKQLKACLSFWIFKFSIERYKQTFDVTLEELGQDAIRGQLVEHTAEELFGYTCYIPRDQHTVKHNMKNGCVGQSIIKLIYKHSEYLSTTVWHI